MTGIPTIVCPVDFSDGSRSALLYASAIADHFGATLIVVTVEDPLLAAAAAHASIGASLAADTELELRRFCGETLVHASDGPKTLQFRVAVGKPAPEILRIASEAGANMIVISSRGSRGLRKLFFGSTTERVLRETPIPVLVTPGEPPSSASLSEIAAHINRIIVPVDLTPASRGQVTVAAAIAVAVSVPVIVAHVMEPVFIPAGFRGAMPGADASRREEAEEALNETLRLLPAHVRTESLLLTGEPSEEIVKFAQARGSNLIVMGLRSGGLLGPRVGSVTYRVLCLTRALVLALPPVSDGHPDRQPEVRAERTSALQER
jgi:nucleotide-binding universal stress UspA family protein